MEKIRIDKVNLREAKAIRQQLDAEHLPTVPCPRCLGWGRITDDWTMGHLMRILRNKMGLTANEVGRRMGLSEATISRMESGQRRWTPARIEEYKKAVE